MIKRLWIKEAKVRHIPWIADVLVGLWVLHHVGFATYDFSDDVGSFPLWGELVYFVLLQSQH